jgi:hypothetical protein
MGDGKIQTQQRPLYFVRNSVPDSGSAGLNKPQTVLTRYSLHASAMAFAKQGSPLSRRNEILGPSIT